MVVCGGDKRTQHNLVKSFQSNQKITYSLTYLCLRMFGMMLGWSPSPETHSKFNVLETFFGCLWKVSKASVWTSCKDMLKHVWKILRWLSIGKHVLCVRQGQRAGVVGFLFEILVTSVGSGLSSSETLNSLGTKFGTILAWVTMCKVIFLRVWT